MIRTENGEKYYKASDVVQRISKKYQANKVWIWDVLEKQYGRHDVVGCKSKESQGCGSSKTCTPLRAQVVC